MKKFVSIMLALAMSISLAACSADSSSDASSDSRSSSDAASGEKVVKIGVFEACYRRLRCRRQAGDAGYAVRQPYDPHRGHRRRDWSVIHAQLAVFFDDRMPD